MADADQVDGLGILGWRARAIDAETDAADVNHQLDEAVQTVAALRAELEHVTGVALQWQRQVNTQMETIADAAEEIERAEIECHYLAGVSENNNAWITRLLEEQSVDAERKWQTLDKLVELLTANSRLKVRVAELEHAAQKASAP